MTPHSTLVPVTESQDSRVGRGPEGHQSNPLLLQDTSYRTIVRPTYKQAYKTVTALEWKCCPGHTGANCEAAFEVLLEGAHVPPQSSLLKAEHTQFSQSLLQGSVSKPRIIFVALRWTLLIYLQNRRLA
ncbi:EMI domain-containing protein 1 [Varanus komodoensis]|nr:EMI domain-containing protein 1 [Varanus komodoensis]